MKIMANCYAVDSTMADVYCNLPDISVCQDKTFPSVSSGIDSSTTRKDRSETLTNNYYGNPTVVPTTYNLQNISMTRHSNLQNVSVTRHSRALSPESKNYYSNASVVSTTCNLQDISETRHSNLQNVSEANHSNLQSISETHRGNLQKTPEIHPSNLQNMSEMRHNRPLSSDSNNYYNNASVVTTTCNLQTISDTHHSRQLSSDSIKSEYFADVEKTDDNKILEEDSSLLPSFSSIKDGGGEEPIPRIYTMDMEVEEDSKVFGEDNTEVLSMNSSTASEHADGLQVHGKIFTVDSVVTEPPTGLQKKQNGNWVCDICGHEELLKDDILTHRILHLSDDHSKQCPICEKKFSSLTSLRNHLTVHTGIKKFHCKYCGRKFGWKTQLAIHENLHTGKGLHHCQVCSKSFMTKWLLQRHLKIHLKESRRSEKLENSNWSKTDPKAAPQKYDNFLEISTSNCLTSASIESQTPAKFSRCHECDLNFKSEELLAYHLLEHNSSKQNGKCNVSMKNPSSLDEPSDRGWDISLENWSATRCGNEDNTHFVETMDQERLKLSNLKTTSKGSLTSIVSKLHHKVDEKQKSDEPAEVLILKNSEDNHYLKDNSMFKEGLPREYKLTESSKQPLSSSSDPFISGMLEVEPSSESSLRNNISTSTCNTKHIDQQHCFTKSHLAPNELSSHVAHAHAPAHAHSAHNGIFEKEMRSYFVKQEKEMSSLQSLVATLHGKVDSLTNIVTSQSLLINRIFLGGKMVVNGNLDFNVRPTNAE